jgi:hypothetical protein
MPDARPGHTRLGFHETRLSHAGRTLAPPRCGQLTEGISQCAGCNRTGVPGEGARRTAAVMTPTAQAWPKSRRHGFSCHRGRPQAAARGRGDRQRHRERGRRRHGVVVTRSRLTASREAARSSAIRWSLGPSPGLGRAPGDHRNRERRRRGGTPHRVAASSHAAKCFQIASIAARVAQQRGGA